MSEVTERQITNTGTSPQIDNILESIYTSSCFDEIKSSAGKSLYLTGVNGSLMAFIVSYLYKNINKKIFFLSHDPEKISNVKDDLELITDTDSLSVFAPGRQEEAEELSKTLTGLAENEEFIVLSAASSLSHKIITKQKYKESLTELKKNAEFSFDELIVRLNKYNFLQKDFVEGVGDYSVRGGIVDLFPESYDTPLRIEFFGDTIESIREFDITTQRSLKEIDSVRIGMNLSVDDPFIDKQELEAAKQDTILDYITDDTLVVIDEPAAAVNAIKEAGAQKLLDNRSVYITSFANAQFEAGPGFKQINISSYQQPDFHSNLKALYKNLGEYSNKGFDIYILCSDEYQCKRLSSLLEDFEDDYVFNRDDEVHKQNDESPETITYHISKERLFFVPDSIHKGFTYPDAKTVVYTEHQVFGRFFRQIKKRKKKFKGLSLNELKELQYGDYIVHRDFGIGMFAGLKKIKVGSNEQEVVKISYEGGDTVFLNLNYIHLIKKYASTEGYVPKLTKLGGGEWDKIKERAKKKVKDIARDLIILYAKRKTETGFRFSGDTHWQRELEAGFMYEDTPDQLQATIDVKEDMESRNPMDRLVCGDVGFGKTEIAVRAAFKAVMDNKQVAVLVPTTILAIQHYNTFRDRLSPFAVEVDVLSRLQSKKDQKKTLERLAEGKVNILVGTHRILSKDIDFKDLGLLIIDEEQRFGVKAKEKLRTLKPNVDTLTLTATPIPRTLNFSLLGARDLSVINTPPKNRKPIHTEIIKLDWNNITNIIRDEFKRGGQVYFVNDKINKLYELADTIKEYVPSAKVGIAHGKMTAAELEDLIVSFIEKKLNILVCTKIIESGLDIPNVNTIIINNADMYGLSELYQLRGRVGRSDQQAYAYLISSGGKLTKGAIKRLQAMEEFTELGSGINLSMRDMEIRGVGNLLGKEQSGFVQQIGFEMFMSVIDEAVEELKESEFKDIFKDEIEKKRKTEEGESAQRTLIKKKEDPAIIENDLNALIPEDYITNDTERLNIYRRLFEAQSREELNTIKEELRDRFGEYLEDVDNLFRIVALKIQASETGIEKISISGKSLTIQFPSDREHRIYKGDFFTKMINLVSSNSRKYAIAGKDRLIIEVKLEDSNDARRIEELERILSL
jgi:transcription-repair coupling factor (superfamily II helicase)